MAREVHRLVVESNRDSDRTLTSFSPPKYDLMPLSISLDAPATAPVMRSKSEVIVRLSGLPGSQPLVPEIIGAEPNFKGEIVPLDVGPAVGCVCVTSVFPDRLLKDLVSLSPGMGGSGMISSV